MSNNSNLGYAELHRHLQGSFSISLFKELQLEREPLGVCLSAPKWVQNKFFKSSNISRYCRSRLLPDLLEYSCFDDFISAYIFSIFLLANKANLEKLIRSTFEDFKGEGLSYVELTVAPSEYEFIGIELPELLELLSKLQIEAVNKHKIQVAWIMDPIRNLGQDNANKLLRQLVDYGKQPFSAVTLGGNEAQFPPELFADFYKQSRELGLGLSIHAGETLGPSSVKYTVEALGVDRVGHGVRSIEDPKLVEYLARKEIPLEICISSNLCTRIYKDLQDHPIQKLFRAGVPISINTDDPFFFHTSLPNEYKLLQSISFSELEIDKIKETSWQHRFAK